MIFRVMRIAGIAGIAVLIATGCGPSKPEVKGPGLAATSNESSDGMVRIPAGVFIMGSNDGDADEKPVHQVRVSAFEMDVTEVTVGAYRACVNAGKCASSSTADWKEATDQQKANASRHCNWLIAGRENHPMNCVDWNHATAYCAYAGKRLPTEEEWEYAARRADGRMYPWGNGDPSGQLCWKRSDGTCAVGSYPSGDSPFGLHDMAGNVWEWTASGYSSDYRQSRANEARVDRGGNYLSDAPADVRSTLRFSDSPSLRSPLLGFRCARQRDQRPMSRTRVTRRGHRALRRAEP